MRFGLKEEVISKINSVFVRYPEIDEVVIYGSRAKGSAREGSDIDITLKGQNISRETLSRVWLDIDVLNTPYLFDISVFCDLESQNLIDHIERVGKRLYSKQEK